MNGGEAAKHRPDSIREPELLSMRQIHPQANLSSPRKQRRNGFAAATVLILCLFVSDALGFPALISVAVKQDPNTTIFLAPATFTVTNIDDSGPGSLRKAILDANGIAGSHTINFQLPPGNQTIILTSGELLISNHVTINGPGADLLAISGNNVSRVFRIGDDVSATISGLSIINGNADFGAGIRIEIATLYIANCVISGNSATSSGGGIYNLGSVAISGTTISGNTAITSGGGLNNHASPDMEVGATIANSTISSNSANTGGGVASSAIGTASIPSLISTRIVSSTLSGNSAVNGGAISNGRSGIATSTTRIGNSILQAGVSGVNIFNSSTVQSLGFNISSDNGGGFLAGSGDQINADPLLGALQNNGGTTPTHLPLAGSPAIDKGKILDGLTTDQRGLSRPSDDPSIANAAGGDGSDIGAVEVHQSTSNPESCDGNLDGIFCDGFELLE